MHKISTISRDLFQLLQGVHRMISMVASPKVFTILCSLSVIVRKDKMSQLTYHVFTLHTPTNIPALTGREPPQSVMYLLLRSWD